MAAASLPCGERVTAGVPPLGERTHGLVVRGHGNGSVVRAVAANGTDARCRAGALCRNQAGVRGSGARAAPAEETHPWQEQRGSNSAWLAQGRSNAARRRCWGGAVDPGRPIADDRRERDAVAFWPPCPWQSLGGHVIQTVGVGGHLRAPWPRRGLHPGPSRDDRAAIFRGLLRRGQLR